MPKLAIKAMTGTAKNLRWKNRERERERVMSKRGQSDTGREKIWSICYLL